MEVLPHAEIRSPRRQGPGWLAFDHTTEVVDETVLHSLPILASCRAIGKIVTDPSFGITYRFH
jgi:hypothetical protein